MLHRIFGACAKTKSEYFLQELALRCREKRPVFFIVPEQMTVTYEARVAALEIPESHFYLETLNFSRLPNRIFRQIGGISQRPIDRTGKQLILAKAVRSLEGECPQLDARIDRPRSLERLMSQLNEFEDFHVTPATLEQLAKVAKQENKTGLSQKLGELAAIVRRYRELLDAQFDDTVSETQRLLDALDQNPVFADSYIYIDGFYDFTADQYALIRRMIAQAREVYVGLTCPRPQGDSRTVAVRAQRAANRLKAMTDRLEDVILEEPESFPAPLKHLAHQLFLGREPWQGEVTALHLTQCPSAYDEVCAIAAQIRRLVQKGARYRDIAVAYRQDRIYPQLCQSIFPRYDIPFHVSDQPENRPQPMAQLMECACRMAGGDLRLKTVRNYWKTGLCGLSEEESFDLESYALLWNLQGKAWLEDGDWQMPPQGYGEAMNDRQRQDLERLNASRRRLMAPIAAFKQRLQAPTLHEKLQGLVELLQKLQVPQQIQQEADDLRRRGDFAAADDTVALFNALLGALSQLDLTLGELEVSREEFADYLHLALKGCQAGTLPPAPDCVSVGEAAFARNDDCKILFLPGLNAGIFPAEEPKSGLLTEAERRLFREQKVELAQDGEDFALNEYFLLDQLIRTPSQALYLSYHRQRSAADANPCAPSTFVHTVKQLFPQLKEDLYAPELALPTCREEAFGYYCAHFGQENALTEYLKEYFAQAPRLEPLHHAADFCESQQDLKAPPFPAHEDLALTQSRIDCYIRCRYQYFANYMLKLRQPPSAFPDEAQSGSLNHYVLENFFAQRYAQEPTPPPPSPQEVHQQVLALCQAYFADYARTDRVDRAKLDHLIRQATRSLSFVIQNTLEELEQSAFVPVMFEAEVPGDVKPYCIPLPDGSQLKLYGKIDRVDLFRAPDGQDYVRVVDYKSGHKEFNLQDVYNGLNQQMLIYLFCLWRGKLKRPQGELEVTPAGILYARASQPSLQEADAPRAMETARRRMVRNGLLLDRPEVLEAMEKEPNGLFIPKGNPAKYLATLEQFGVLERHTQRLLKRVATQLKQGRTSGPTPLPPVWTAVSIAPIARYASKANGAKRSTVILIPTLRCWR